MILSSRLLSRFPELVHGFTTRTMPNLSTHSVMTLKQIHSSKVVIVQKQGSPSEEGDALITRQPGLLVGVRTADCVPLLVYDPGHRIVSAIHAGWRGLISGVIESTLQCLKKNFNSNFSQLQAALGPALCPGCFEIGPEVAGQFKNKFKDHLTISPGPNDRSFVDLRKGCSLILEESGIPPPSIDVVPHCTACEPELFFSYRQGDHDERMMAFIGIR